MPYKNRADLYAAQKRHRQKVRAKLFEFLSTQACVDCGENDPILLEFDHIGKDDKFKDVAKLLSGHYSWLTIEKEIAKCAIRCANCHRRKTYIESGWWGRSKPL